VPDFGLPGGTRKRTVTRLLRRALWQYEIAATLGPCLRVMRSCRPVRDTGAGVNIVRTSVLPANWMAYAEELTTLLRIRDANNNRLVTKYAIHLYVDTGGVRLLLIPKFCPGGQRLTCGRTLSTNQMRPWD